MRTYLLSIILLITMSIASAQQFAPVGTTWHYGESWAFSGAKGFVKVISISDTIVLGKNCRVIGVGGFPCGTTGPIYAYDEDSVVYFYQDSVGTFEILFDLKANQGDKWNAVYHTDRDVIDTVEAKVDSVRFTMVSGIAMRTLHISTRSTNNGQTKYGIGKIVGFLGDVFYLMNFWAVDAVCDMNHPEPLRCFDDGTIYYKPWPLDCEYTSTGLGEFQSGRWKAYPNPASDVIWIENEQGDKAEIEILDHLGRVYLQSEIEGEATLNVESLPTGIFLLRFKRQRDAIPYSTRIVIDHRP